MSHSDVDAVNVASDLFAGRIWDAVVEFMLVETETVPAVTGPTRRWVEVSQQTREVFIAALLEKGQLARGVITAIGQLQRLEQESRN